MIKTIWLQEYGPFREAKLSLAPLTVLVGPNASGKTMAMEAPRRVQKAAEGAARAIGPEFVYDEFFESFRRRAATAPTYVAFELGSSTFFFSEPGATEPPMEGAQPITPDTLAKFLIQLLKFDPDSLRSPSYLEAYQLTIQPNGYGLATVLADMKLQDDERLAWIEDQVSTIIPNFERARVKRAEVDRAAEPVVGHELIFDIKGAPDLWPDLVSDGTVLVLGIVTTIAATRSQPQDVLILIDDLERGLHPRALSEFIGCLRRMTEEMDVQIVATSHSPYLLDSLRPEEVRLTGFLDDGSATICELSDHPEFERWKDVMTPGEFWSTAGEDWIRDARK